MPGGDRPRSRPGRLVATTNRLNADSGWTGFRPAQPEFYSTVTVLARFRGLSTSNPLALEMAYANN